MRLASALRTSRQSKYIALIRVSWQLSYRKNAAHYQVTPYRRLKIQQTSWWVIMRVQSNCGEWCCSGVLRPPIELIVPR